MPASTLDRVAAPHRLQGSVRSGLAPLLIVASLSGTAAAADYDESLLGDLSNDRLAPTRIALTYGRGGANGLLGNNILTGTTGSVAGVVDRDYLNFAVPAAFVLSELRVGNQTTVGGTASFIGLAAGTTMPVPESTSTAAGLLGWKLFGAADRGTDILDDMDTTAQGASGFDRPLVAGDYTLWIQELATGTFTYRLNLVLTPVPEPGPLALMALGLGAVLAVARRRATRQTERYSRLTASSSANCDIVPA
jgi:hypothetical protein